MDWTWRTATETNVNDVETNPTSILEVYCEVSSEPNPMEMELQPRKHTVMLLQEEPLPLQSPSLHWTTLC